MDGADRFSAGLIVRLPEAQREVNAECDPREPVAGLIDAILEEVGGQPGGDLYVVRTGRRLQRDEPLSSQPLAHGDVLSTEAPDPEGRSPIRRDTDLYLVGSGGVGIGARWPLGPGRHRVGRSRDCEIFVDDPALSRTHLTLEVERDRVRVSDAGSTNGTFIGGVRVHGERTLDPGDVIEAGASLFTVERTERGPGRTSAPDADGYIRFNRPPRVALISSDTPLVVPAPPPEAATPRLPVASAALPLIAAVALWWLFPDNPSLLLIVALSPLMVVFSFAEERRRGRGVAKSEQERWRRDVTEALQAVETARADAVRLERERAPGLAKLEAMVDGLTADLWLRRPGDPDFLILRCGWGDRRWDAPPAVEPGGSDNLRREALAQLEPLRTLPSVPLTASLDRLGVIGLTGDAPRVSDLIRWWIVQLVTLHSPEEVACVLLVPEAEAGEWSWTTWLPHFPNEATEGFVRPAEEQLHALVHLLETRRAGRHQPPDVVVIVDERAALPRSLISSIMREGPAHGIHLVWHGSRRQDLPGECAAIVEIDQDDGVELTITGTGDSIAGAFEGIEADRARRLATTLAPLRDAAPRSAGRELPSHVTLFDALEVERPDAGWVSARWRGSNDGLSVPIGRSAQGSYVLDLVEDGPHALVGGTTGSGKSELLQTIVASLAATYPPTQLNLLLVDYKGGAAFKDCAALPHAVGSVTDLDPHLSERALISLDAEVRRRETVLREAGARDITELTGATTPGLPRLLLVVDEFATLIKEVPGFVDGVVDLAQRGRSLGISVILATQRPAGVINDSIRANTNLRIALRVADEADSENVIGIKDAAHIPRSIPGRAYARTGHGEVEEIQCAFGGATRRAAAPAARVWDRASASSSTAADAGSASTQLEQLVALLRAVARSEGYAAPRRPWLPPLADALSLFELQGGRQGKTLVALIGLTDVPDQQRQEVAAFDPEVHGGLLVFGTGRSGKTSVLRTIAASLAATASPDEVHLYGIDFAGSELRALSVLPHVGDVVTGDEPERVERLFDRLRSEVSRRQRDLKDRGGATFPKVIVLLDGYAGFAAAYERVDFGALVDGLPTLVTEGRAVGIHFVITAERRAAVPQALGASIGLRLVLRMGDPGEYADLGLDARRLRGTRLPPGRGFIDGKETQVATLSATDPTGAADETLRRLAQRVPPGATRPPKIRLLPREVVLASLPDAGGSFRAVLGLVEDDDLSPGVVDLGAGHFLAAGPYRSGRSTALGTLVASLAPAMREVSFFLLAPRNSTLGELPWWTRVAAGVEMCASELEILASAMADEPDRPRIVVIDDAEELAEGPASYTLEPLIRRARDISTRFVVAGEVKALHRAFSGWITEIRKDRHGLLLDPDPDVDGELLGVRLPRRRRTAPTPPGRGYLVRRGSAEPIQIARA